jgi:hypothetical protein
MRSRLRCLADHELSLDAIYQDVLPALINTPT